MSVERTGFEILMTADASGVVRGSKEGADALGTVAEKTKGLNEELEKGKEKLGDHAKGMEEGAHHAGLFGKAHHEAHAALHSLGEIMPGIGTLARDMFNPATLAIGVFGLILGRLIEHIQETGEAAAKMEEQISKATAEAARLTGEAMEAMGETNRRYWESLAGKEMDAAIAKFGLVAKGIETVRKAQDAAEEAEIQRKARSGEISAEEGQARIAGIHRGAAERGAAGTEGEISFRLAEEKKRLGEAQGIMLTDAERRQLAGDLSDKTSQTKEGGTFETQLAALDKKIEAAQAKSTAALNAGNQPEHERLMKENEHLYVERAAIQKDLNDAKKAIEDGNARLAASDRARATFGELGGENGKVALDELALAVAKAVTAGAAAAPVGVAGAESLLDRGRAVLGDAANAQNHRQRTQSDAQITALLKDFTDFVAGHPTINGDVDRDLQNQINELRQQLRWNRFREQYNRNL